MQRKVLTVENYEKICQIIGCQKAVLKKDKYKIKKIVKTMSFNFRSSKEAKIILSNESKLKAEGKNTHKRHIQSDLSHPCLKGLKNKAEAKYED